jgi:hypothetical protein
MSIKITISQFVPKQFGEKAYYAKDTDITFSLDGNADNACMFAGKCLASAIRSHYGDKLLIVVHANDKLVARWVGIATDKTAIEFEAFMYRPRADYFKYLAYRIYDYKRVA